VSDSGIIGLFIGHYRFAPSRNITITDDRFTRTRTNAIAIQGADSVLIARSTFTGNHWHGLWPVPGVSRGITTGGQIRIADASNVEISGNSVTDSRCANCNPPGQPVVAVELGDEDRSAPGVSDMTLDGNDFNAPIAVYRNPGAAIIGVKIGDNRLRGRTRWSNVP
jgi:hypothetical protein